MKGKRIRKILIYTVFTLAAFVIFLYWRFPEDVFREIIAAKASDWHPSCSASIGGVRPAFPPGLKIQKTVLWFNARPEANIQLDRIDINPDVWRLLRAQTRLDLVMKGYGGRAIGRMSSPGFFSFKGPFSSQIKFENIPIQEVAYLKYLLGREMTGKLKGTVSYAHQGKDPAAGTGRIDFNIQNGSYPVFDKVFGMDKVDFTELEGQLNLADRMLKIEKINLNGDKARCALKGDIIINFDEIKNSQLNLTCNLELRSASVPVKIVLTITGTFMSPVISNKAG